MNNNVAICAIAKNENHYLLEWISYHLSLGFSHIFIYDNNDINGEKISSVIHNNTNVTIIDYRGKQYVQHKAYTECFNKFKNIYDWFLFLDIDEFLILETCKTINDFLNLSQFKQAEIIRFNWKHFSDNNLLDVIDNNYNVMNRFTLPIKYYKDVSGKSIIKSTVDIGNRYISAHGYCNEINYSAVNVNGNRCDNTNTFINEKPLYKYAWINHYRTKTIGEYIRQKYFRGDASSKQYIDKYSNLDFFFETNVRTTEKEEYGKNLIKQLNNI